MHETAILPEFGQIDKSLSHIDPSESHGMLCGMLCADKMLNRETWVAQVMSETAEINLSAQSLLQQLFNATAVQLNDSNFGFYLLLPDDETALSIRAGSLGHWCQGYLSGLGLGDLRSAKHLSGEVNEFLDDVLKIAQVVFFGNDASEDDEVAYMEIVEYVRVGVLLVKQSLHSESSSHAVYNRHH